MGALYNGITLPMVLIRLGMARGFSVALGAIAFICFLPALSRANVLLAMSCTSLLSLALSAHAWMYDAAICSRRYSTRWRTSRAVANEAYCRGILLAALWMPIDAAIRFNPLAIITLGGAAYAPWRFTTKRSGRTLQS